MKILAIIFASFALASPLFAASANPSTILISVPDQEMILFQNGVRVASYSISTSRFGLGDRPGSYRTPLGQFTIAEKIGAGYPVGAVFKGRRPTGEVVKVNASGRDPIVTRILWLDGLEAHNDNAHSRGIYIHGTPQEALIGRPSSYGCIRMRSKDIVELYQLVNEGTAVHIVDAPMSRVIRRLAVIERAGRKAG